MKFPNGQHEAFIRAHQEFRAAEDEKNAALFQSPNILAAVARTKRELIGRAGTLYSSLPVLEEGLIGRSQKAAETQGTKGSKKTHTSLSTVDWLYSAGQLTDVPFEALPEIAGNRMKLPPELRPDALRICREFTEARKVATSTGKLGIVVVSPMRLAEDGLNPLMEVDRTCTWLYRVQ